MSDTKRKGHRRAHSVECWTLNPKVLSSRTAETLMVFFFLFFFFLVFFFIFFFFCGPNALRRYFTRKWDLLPFNNTSNTRVHGLDSVTSRRCLNGILTKLHYPQLPRKEMFARPLKSWSIFLPKSVITHFSYVTILTKYSFLEFTF